jgi:hypothetical protein
MNLTRGSITLAEAKAFKKKLANSIFPEISLNLHLNYTTVLAENLGCPVEEILACRVHKKYSRIAEAAVRKLLAGKKFRASYFGAANQREWELRTLKRLRRANRSRELVELLDEAVTNVWRPPMVQQRVTPSWRCADT